MRKPVAILLLLAAALSLTAGCSTNYYAIVTREGAPLYDDDDRGEAIGRLHRLDDVYIGHSAPSSDPVPVKVGGRKGWVNRRDLRVYSTHNDGASIAEGTFRARRDVDVEGRDWPQQFKRAIREDRVEAGMSREMVELAWGRASGVDRLKDGGETWRYDDTIYDVYDTTGYAYYPGGVHPYATYAAYGWHRPWGHGYGYGYGYGPGFGVAWDFPSYEPIHTRTWIPRTVRRAVVFDGDGRVIGFDNRGAETAKGD